MHAVFIPSPLCLRNRIPRRNLWTIVLPRDFLHVLPRVEVMKRFLRKKKTLFFLKKTFLDFRLDMILKKTGHYKP